jgi:hypothetical protein
LSKRLVEQVVPFNGKRREQPAFVAEVVGGRGMRDAGPACEISQADPARAVLKYGGRKGIEEGTTEVAVVVRRSRH